MDILAPGVDIESSWYKDGEPYKTISGTSMACPHVAGRFCTQQGETWTGLVTWPYVNTRGLGLCGQKCVQVSSCGVLYREYL